MKMASKTWEEYYYLRASEGQKAALWPNVGQMLEGPEDVDQQGREGHQKGDDQPNGYVREWSCSAVFDGFGFLQVREHPIEVEADDGHQKELWESREVKQEPQERAHGMRGVDEKLGLVVHLLFWIGLNIVDKYEEECSQENE